MGASEEDQLTEDEILGHMAYVACCKSRCALTDGTTRCSTFIFAGMDTTSNALARTLDLLSKHQGVQDKLRAEILEAMREHGTEIPYDVLVELPYLDAVCREALRLCVRLFAKLCAPR